MSASKELEFLWLNVLGIAITFMLAVSVILFVLLYQRKLFAKQLELQQMGNIYQKSLLVNSIQAQENERRRIAGDLHDEVGAMLSTAKLYASSITLNHEHSELSHKIVEILDLATQNLRNISHNITPQNLEKFGLISALSENFAKINESKLLKIDFAYNLNKRLLLEQEMGLYRITQELLNNTLKHSGATAVEIRLEFRPQKLIFSYKDNGKGFDLGSMTLNHKKGLGLKNIASRAEVLQSKINFESAPDQGFNAHLTIDI
jgi:signal transduction histidine kinase